MATVSIDQFNQAYPPQRRDRCQTWPLKQQRRRNPNKVKAPGCCKFLSIPKRQLVCDYHRVSLAVKTIRKENFSLKKLRESILPAIKTFIESIKSWIMIFLRFFWNSISLNYAGIAKQADLEGSTGLDDHSDVFHCARLIRFDNYHIQLEDDISGNIIRMPFRYILAFICVIYIFTTIIFGLTYIIADMIDTQLAYSAWFWFMFSLSTTTCLNSDTLDPNRVHIVIILLANVQAFIAQLFLAFITGIVFSRIARPISQIQFADFLVMNPSDSIQHIQGRLTTIRPRFLVLDCTIKLFIMRRYQTQEGEHGKRWTQIPLINDSFPRMSIMIKFEHELNETSPLLQALNNPDEDFVVTVYFTGTEACSLNPIRAQKSYNRQDIYRNFKFIDMVKDVPLENGGHELTADFNKLNQLVPSDHKTEISNE